MGMVWCRVGLLRACQSRDGYGGSGVEVETLISWPAEQGDLIMTKHPGVHKRGTKKRPKCGKKVKA